MMTCNACKGRFDVDRQNDYAICPWCGTLNSRTPASAGTISVPSVDLDTSASDERPVSAGGSDA